MLEEIEVNKHCWKEQELWQQPVTSDSPSAGQLHPITGFGLNPSITAGLGTEAKEVSVPFILISIVKGFLLMEHNCISPQDFRRELIYNSILYRL